MYFTLTKEQVDIQRAAREFAEKEFRPVARELDAKESFDDRLWKRAAELGFLAVFVSENYGGLGLGYLDQCLILEEFARVDLGVTHAIESTFFGSQLILLVGDNCHDIVHRNNCHDIVHSHILNCLLVCRADH